MLDKPAGLELYNTSELFVPQVSCLIVDFFSRPYGFNVPYRKLFQAFETIVGRYQGRAHWAKPHYLQRDELRALYPCFDDFTHVLDTVDPNGIFRNEYIQRHIMGKLIDPRVFKSIH
jgi:L-gulonolactone oxidase